MTYGTPPGPGTMDEAGSGSEAWVERAVRYQAGAGATVTGGPVWLIVRPDGAVLPEHGWKLHVSSRAADFAALVDVLLPVLVAEGCVFKLARSARVLRELNDGQTAPASVGKAVTVYPDQRRIRELGLRLARALRGHQGPRVLSDRQVSAGAPVYYRYGSFAVRRSPDARGRPETRLYGPNGEEFDALAGLSYRQPSWAADPFTGDRRRSARDRRRDHEGDHEGEDGCGDGRDRGDAILGGRYRLVVGIREAAQGNLFRAIDTRDGRAVVIKQARALVAEHGDRNDSRLRLRNERRVLRALAGVSGVPRFIDHFRHGADEFLVTSDCGPRTLAADVQLGGPYRPGPGTGARSLDRLAAGLARILTAVHERGVIMRDLSPANVVVGDEEGAEGSGDGAVSVVDFGLAALDGLHLPGRTPGYAPPRQARDEPPRDTDDLHALGMTLLFAATGLHPVTLGEDPELARTRALQTAAREYGRAPSGVVSAIAALLDAGDGRDGDGDGDGDADGGGGGPARTAVRQLAAGATTGSTGENTEGSGGGTTGNGARPVAVRSLPAPPAVTGDLAAEVTDGLLRDLLGLVDGVLDAPEDSQAAHDVSVFSGSAGIGLELLHHGAHREVTERIRELAAFTVRAARRASLSPGLFTGATGVDLFLREAAGRGLGAAQWPGRSLPSPEWTPESADLIDGTAGVGLGHLYLFQLSQDPADLEVARRCARAIAAARPPGRGSARGAADLATGRAHGLAGTAELLVRLAAETGDAPMLETATGRVRDLAERARSLVSEAKDPAAEPMTVSWCRGLAGIGQTLLHAGTVLDDASLTDLAREAADACIVRVPQLSTLGQCCGAAGVGNYLLDVAAAVRSERHREAACDVATQLLLRGAGPPANPRFFAPRTSPDRALSWSHGLAGILTFFRRLAHGDADRLTALR